MKTEILKKRLKSLVWRLGMMVLAMVVTFTADNLDLFNFSGEITIVLGLVLGEVSKWLNVDLRSIKA